MEVDIDINCPECDVTLSVSTRDIATGRTVRCRRGALHQACGRWGRCSRSTTLDG